MDLECAENDYPNLGKFLKTLQEFRTYIENNQALIPNYGERWRYGETISTAFVESTINQVVAKRFVKEATDAIDKGRHTSALTDENCGAQWGVE